MTETTRREWRAICPLSDIAPQGARVLQRPGQIDVAVFRTIDDEVFAVLDRCPHKGGPLSAGLVHGRSVTCPLHGLVIELADGQARAPDEGCVRTVPAKLAEGMIYLDLDGT